MVREASETNKERKKGQEKGGHLNAKLTTNYISMHSIHAKIRYWL